ncbi:MAG: tetratricopeptide repeat protein [Acidobacteriota bacterium]
MRSRILVALAVLLALPLIWPATPVLAQVGFVSGTVTDADGNPIKGATIRVEELDGGRKYKLTTNKKGYYLHAGIQMGNYRVICEAEGFRPDYVQPVRPGHTRDEPQGIVNFKMVPGSGTLNFDLTEEDRANMAKRQAELKKQAEKLEKIRGDFDAANTLYNNGQYQEAATAYQQILAEDAEQHVIWAKLGMTYAKLGNDAKAAESYEKAVELDPSNAAYLQNLGSVYASMGDDAKARELYQKAAEIGAAGDPKDAAMSFYNMGVTYINAGKNQEASEALTKAIKFDPTYSEAYYQLGLTLLGLGKMDEALTNLKKYVEMSPQSANAAVAKELIKQLGG